MQLKLQKCAVVHLDELIGISKKTFVDAFETQNNPDDFWEYINLAFASERLETELKNPNSSFYFVYLGQHLTGYFKLNENDSQTDIKATESIEIERIYLLQEFQGMKIGQWMLKQIKIQALAKNKTFLWLGVWERNTGAIGFYKKNGFTEFGKHPYYIGKDKQIDLLMRLDLGTSSIF